MAWQGRYYYRSKRNGERVSREYFGAGELGALAAEADALNSAERASRKQIRRAERQRQRVVLDSLKKLIEWTELLARASLVAAGFRQHFRGAWRRKGDDKS